MMNTIDLRKYSLTPAQEKIVMDMANRVKFGMINAWLRGCLTGILVTGLVIWFAKWVST